MRGGFKRQFIQTCLTSAAKGYQKMLKSELTGGQPVNRPASVGAKTRRIKKIIAKSSWFKKKGQGQITSHVRSKSGQDTRSQKTDPPPETILFVPFTKGSQLKKELQKIDKQVSNSKYGRVRVTERLGTSLINLIGNQAPWRSQHCGRDQCWPCISKEGSCKSHKVTYSITCITCLSQGQKKT